MSATLEAFLRSWPFDPWLLGGLLVAAGVYLRGWLRPSPADPSLHGFPTGRRVQENRAGTEAASFAFSSAWQQSMSPSLRRSSRSLLCFLSVHMLQHLLLMMVAPPLLWLGAPLFPCLRGLPAAVRRYWVGPFLSSPALRRFFGRLTHPLTALGLFVAVTWLWHVPAVYDMALRSSGLHYLQHACFVGAALLFWYPVVRPYPVRPSWSPWLLLPVLLIADLSNTVLSALLTFSDRVLYTYYAEVPRLGGVSAVDDQSTAGVLMWVPGSIAFLVPLFAIGVRLLQGGETDKETRRRGERETRTDKETRRQGERETEQTRRQGGKETGRQKPRDRLRGFRFLSLHLSPCLQVSRSPCLVLTCSLCP